MTHTKNIKYKIGAILILVLVIVGLSLWEKSFAAISKKPFGGKVKIIPSYRMTAHKNLCFIHLLYCIDVPPAVATAATWTSPIEDQTFTLLPDVSPTKGNLYYIPPGVTSKTKTTLSVGKWIKGLYSNVTMVVGTCTCTRVTTTYPPVTTVIPLTISDNVSRVTLWGTSKK